MITNPLMVTVSQLNRYLKAKMDEDDNLASIFVTGEISNFTNHYKSGHLYFSLKDEKSAVKAVMFSSQAAKLRFMPQDGMKVIVHGKVSVYETSGQYQIYVTDMQPDGIGALNLAYEQLKKKLEGEGLFSASRKKKIPLYPERIGEITSPTGAAVQDILQILGRRYPVAEVILAPVLVQGEGSAAQIMDALERFNRLKCADVLILGRGGGSIEDLWTFNEESVARAVASSQIPVISAVGHETDFTICDFVADLRAPTPSAAAELATPDQKDLLDFFMNYRYTVQHLMKVRFHQWSQQLDQLSSNRYLVQPELWLQSQRLPLDGLTQALIAGASDQITIQKQRLASYAGKLDGLSPLQVLARGFVYATDSSGDALTDVQAVKIGDPIQLQAMNGTIDCSVTAVKEATRENE